MPFTCGDDPKKARPLDFGQLECLRLFSRQLQQDQTASLQYFAYDVGFQHYKGKKPLKISVSSSATCVLSLVATGNWRADKAQTKALLAKLIAKNTSAGLPRNNPFTIAWILEAVTALEKLSEPLDPPDNEVITKMERMLQNAVRRGGGGVKIESYPPSAYLTQLVVRALRHRSKLTDKLQEQVNEWAWAELTRQLALIQSKSKTADAFAAAYLLMLVAAVTPSSKTNPEQTSIQRAALQTFFDCQLRDGTWPLSRPLFHYRKFGNAYCYEYEMLTQLLQEPELEDLLLDYLPQLSAAAESVSYSVYRVEGGIPAWTSGHHPQQGEPESWATASVYHFIYQLDRLLAEAVRRELFRYLDTPLPRMVPWKKRKKADFAPDFLDSTVALVGGEQSLKDFLWAKFVKPLSDEGDRIIEGRQFEKGTPRSAIFFGPPGTSKTDLSKKVADFLGWPLLEVDPSVLLRKGMDGIQSEANTIFRMLEETERVVVLFDEFDELVRERGSSDSEPFSRLLTTAMLPKLANIHKGAALVFIIATNHIGEFDLAIRRQGRFDLVVQVMPPTYEAKTTKKNWGRDKNVDLEAKLHELNVPINDPIKQQLGALTYAECDDFATALAKVTAPTEAITVLNEHWDGCTLKTRVSPDEETTWADRSKADARLIRFR
jgi:hypothetical protein